MARLVLTVQSHHNKTRVGVLQGFTIGTAQRALRLFEPAFDGWMPIPAKHELFLARTRSESGALVTTRVSRHGNETVGLWIQDSATAYHPDKFPRYSGTVVTAYGVPEGCAVTVESTYHAAIFTKTIDIRFSPLFKGKVEAFVVKIKEEYDMVESRFED